MTVNHVMIGKCQLCHDTEQLRSTLGYFHFACSAGWLSGSVCSYRLEQWARCGHLYIQIDDEQITL